MNELRCAQPNRPYAVVRQAARSSQESSRHGDIRWDGHRVEVYERADNLPVRYAHVSQLALSGVAVGESSAELPELNTDTYDRYRTVARSILGLWSVYDDVVVLEDEVGEYTMAEAIVDEMFNTDATLPDLATGAATKSVYIALTEPALLQINGALLVKAAEWENRSSSASVSVFTEGSVGEMLLTDTDFDIYILGQVSLY